MALGNSGLARKHDFHWNLGILLAQLLYHRQGRVAGLARAEDDFELWVLLAEEALQVLPLSRLAAMQRLQHGDWGEFVGVGGYRLDGRALEAASGHDYQTEKDRRSGQSGRGNPQQYECSHARCLPGKP